MVAAPLMAVVFLVVVIMAMAVETKHVKSRFKRKSVRQLKTRLFS